MTTHRPVRRWIRTLALGTATAVLMAGQHGCVRRTMTIRTAPEGATVRLNDLDVGQTPVTVDFTWYGDYELQFEKAGYQTLQTHHVLKAPWYQVAPIDFFAEAFVLYTIHDRHEISYDLAPASQPSQSELTQRAREFRDRALYEKK